MYLVFFQLKAVVLNSSLSNKQFNQDLTMFRQTAFLFLILFIFCFFSCSFFDPVNDGDRDRMFSTINFQTGQRERIFAIKREVPQANVEIYVEQSSNGTISDRTIQSIASTFQNDIYHQIRSKFGEESDVDGNNKVTFLLLDIRDDYESDTDSGFIAGYFHSVDLFDQTNSNRKDMFYIDINPTDPTSDLINEVIAHEYQHLINFNERNFRKNLGPQETWLNEGLSMAAEHVYQGDWVSIITNSYTVDPTIDIALGQRFLSWGRSQNDFINYVMVYLFFQWLRIHHPDGDALYRQMLIDSGTDHSVVTRLFGNSVGLDSWTKIMQQFNLALFYNKSSGLQGFGAEGPVDRGRKRLRVGVFNSTSVQLLPPILFSNSNGSFINSAFIELLPGEAIFIGNADNNVNVFKSNRVEEGENIGYYAIRDGQIVGMGAGNYTNVDLMLILNKNTSIRGGSEFIGHVQNKVSYSDGGISFSLRGGGKVPNEADEGIPKKNDNWVPSEYERIKRVTFDANGNLIFD